MRRKQNLSSKKLANQIDVNALLSGEQFRSTQQTLTTATNIVNPVGELNEMYNQHEGKKPSTIVGIILIRIAFLSLVINPLGILKLSNLLNLPTPFYLLGLVFFSLQFPSGFTTLEMHL